MSSAGAPGVAAARGARYRAGLRALALGIVSNSLLIALKGVAGVVGHSQGLVADAIHSAADLVNSSFAFVSLLVSRRPADAAHPYGHGRAEALSATFAAFLIGAAGLLVGWTAIQAMRGPRTTAPDWLTFWVAVVALAVKLVLAVYAGGVARRTRSKAVLADARDHLTDVLSTSVVIAGIVAARFGARGFDSLAGLIVAGFIIFTAFNVFREAALELMDTSVDAGLRDAICARVATVDGVLAVSGIAGRTMADITLVEVHIDVDPLMTAGEAGRVVDAIKRALIGPLPGVHHVVVEMNSSIDEPQALAVSHLLPPTR